MEAYAGQHFERKAVAREESPRAGCAFQERQSVYNNANSLIQVVHRTHRGNSSNRYLRVHQTVGGLKTAGRSLQLPTSSHWATRIRTSWIPTRKVHISLPPTPSLVTNNTQTH